MRTLFAIVVLLLSLNIRAQQKGIKTETFIVNGNCGECKERIENAGDIKGVKLLKWNTESKVASVTFDTAKTDLLKIQQAIAAHGHDAGEVKASEKSYKKLPSCCRYHDQKCEEPVKK